MKKKYFGKATIKDKSDWLAFIESEDSLYDKDKDNDLENKNIHFNLTKKLDLHGLKLDQANKKVEKFVNDSFEKGYTKLIIVTGKGLRSKVEKNPYSSMEMSVLKYSVPEFIKNNENLHEKIKKISKANIEDGGEGSFYIFLKKKKL